MGWDLFGRRRPARRVRLRDQVPTEMVTQSQNLGVRREKSSVSSVERGFLWLASFFCYTRRSERTHSASPL